MPPDGTPAIAKSPEDLRAKVKAQLVDAKPSFFKLQAQLRCLDGGARRDPVIHHDDSPALDRNPRAIADILLPPTVDLRQLPLHFSFNVPGRRRDVADNVLVQDKLRVVTVDNRTEAQLLMARRADLAHEEDIERRS